MLGTIRKERNVTALAGRMGLALLLAIGLIQPIAALAAYNNAV